MASLAAIPAPATLTPATSAQSPTTADLRLQPKRKRSSDASHAPPASRPRSAAAAAASASGPTAGQSGPVAAAAAAAAAASAAAGRSIAAAPTPRGPRTPQEGHVRYGRPPLPRKTLGRGTARKGAEAAAIGTQPKCVDYALHAGVRAVEVLGDAEEAEVVVRVAPRFLTLDSVAVRERQLWGCDVYTDDSDLPCMLQHTGHVALSNQEFHSERLDYLSVRVKVQRYPAGRPGFESIERNGIRSRAWGSAYEGVCLSIVEVAAVKNGKETLMAKTFLACLNSYIPHLVRMGDPEESAELAADVPVSFDSLNEPCLCYNVTAIADKSFDSRMWPSRRLKTEVMYLENECERFELSALPQVDDTGAPGGDGDGNEGRDGSSNKGDAQKDKDVDMDRSSSPSKQKGKSSNDKSSVPPDTGRSKKKNGRKGADKKGAGSRAGSSSDAGDGDSSVDQEADQKPLLLRWARVKQPALSKQRVASCIGSSPADRRRAVKLALRRRRRVLHHLQSQSSAPAVQIPHQEEDVEVLATGFKWDDLLWTPDGVSVDGRYFRLTKLVFKPVSKPNSAPRGAS